MEGTPKRRRMGGSYWRATAAAQSFGRLTEPDLSVDVAVVGGGFTGLSAAYHLAAAGTRVVLLEAHTVGSGASGRNGGQVLPGLDPGFAEIAEAYGVGMARALHAVAADALSLVERLVADERIACDLETAGHLEAAVTPDHMRDLAREMDLTARETASAARLLDAAHMRRATGSAFYAGGLFQPNAMAFHPLRYARGLAAAAVRRGARIAERAAVTAIRPEGGATRLDVAGGPRVRADQVILATDAYTPRFMPALRRQFTAVTAGMIATAPLTPAQRERVLPGRPTVSDMKMPIYYFRLMADGRLLFGHGGAGEKAIGQVFPDLAGVPVTHRWNGRIGITDDGLPRLGRTDEGWLFALGYTGHGAALSTGAGRLLCEAALHPGRTWDALGPLAGLPPSRHPRLHRRAWARAAAARTARP